MTSPQKNFINGPPPAAPKEAPSPALSTHKHASWHDCAAKLLCFVAGTMLRTPAGFRRVETLEVGDLLWTLDNGPRPIRWRYASRPIGSGKQAPICILAGALGPGQPLRDLWISQNHRVLLSSSAAKHLFGTHEVLVPASRLIGLPGVRVASGPDKIAYLHLLLDQHEILLAEGIPTESLLPGGITFEALSKGAQAELQSNYSMFDWHDPHTAAARPIPPPRAQFTLMQHIQKGHGGVLDLWHPPP